MENHIRALRGTDEDYMRVALRLARRAMGRTSPNPMVGAVIVSAGRIAGRGYHRSAGAPHAEVEALRRAGARARGATLYVTLEPCNHTGRTPPCCEAIIAAGISRVVAAMRDPNPITDGRGIARLRRAGISVLTGVLAREARALNEPFCKAMTTGLPWVVAKVGQSLDGKIATARGESRWITSPAARRLGHAWRARVDAMLIGITTVLRDDPRLTARGGGASRAHRPIKVILDSRLRLPLTARCLSAQSPAPTIVATTVSPRHPKARALRARGVELITVPAERGRVSLRDVCRQLVARGIHSVLIEGGGEVLASAFEQRLVDRIDFCIAPVLIGGRTAPSALGGVGVNRLAEAIRLADVVYRPVGPDVRVEARVVSA
jgi:diaminohydroxyphosphoribosylaminopyrimidine deaminase/5-amino-6-(5-phosphoribosylamino)uracil reductase